MSQDERQGDARDEEDAGDKVTEVDGPARVVGGEVVVGDATGADEVG